MPASSSTRPLRAMTLPENEVVVVTIWQESGAFLGSLQRDYTVARKGGRPRDLIAGDLAT